MDCLAVGCNGCANIPLRALGVAVLLYTSKCDSEQYSSGACTLLISTLPDVELMLRVQAAGSSSTHG